MSNEPNYAYVADSAHNNAIELLTEAQLLDKKAHYARAFFLACMSLEELGKSQFVLDYINGDRSVVELNKIFKGGEAHILKLAYQYRRMELKKENGKLTSSIQIDKEDGRILQGMKEQALYEGNDDTEHDWKSLAKEMIEFVDGWFYDILHAEWLNSPKRGSKALWK